MAREVLESTWREIAEDGASDVVGRVECLFGLIGELVVVRGILTALDLDRDRVAAEQIRLFDNPTLPPNFTNAKSST